MSKEIEFGEIVKYIAGFAVLISLFVYLGIVSSTTILVGANNDVAMFIYYIGFFALILSVMGYITGDMELAKQLFSISIIITAISMFLYSPKTDTGYYYGSAVLFLLFGLILYMYFTKYEKGEDVFMKNIFVFLMAVIYLLSVILMGLFLGMSTDDLTTYKFWIMGDVYPQSLLLGGSFSAIFAILLLIYAILELIATSEFIEKLKNLIGTLLPFTWILGFFYSMYIKVLLVIGTTAFGFTGGTGTTLPENLIGVFMGFFMVTNLLSVLYSILMLFLLIHVLSNYAVKE